MTASLGWDHPDTARYFEAFCRRHSRYRIACRKLVEHARIGQGQAILDFAAGTGRSAETVLPLLGAAGRVLCVEPAAPMRSAGMARLKDPRLSWSAEMPLDESRWDRILCSAAIWQLDSLPDWFRRFNLRLRPGGALCFNIPSLYLGEPDEPGGGDDGLLLRLPAILAEKRTSPPPPAREPLPNAAQIDSMLRSAGLHPERWISRARFSYPAYRDWLKIPVNTDGMFAGLPADSRAALVDEAFEQVDRRSWRWESWSGWTAWS
jgi:SAM-dependent methyltransferase